MRIGFVDHFDSFTYNCVGLFETLGHEIVVVSSDTLLWECQSLAVAMWVLGPGPGTPHQTGVSRSLLQEGVPILGICLGHQIIASYFGGKVGPVYPQHGVRDRIFHTQSHGLNMLPNPFWTVRYHSLAVLELPPCLEPIAWNGEGILMGLAHREAPIVGVQFHPDSAGAEYGVSLVEGVLDYFHSF